MCPRSFRQFLRDGESASLLYRAARNLLIDEYRTTREFVELEEDAPLTDASPDAISTLDICLPETLQALTPLQNEEPVGAALLAKMAG